jgi:hypothetical protein
MISRETFQRIYTSIALGLFGAGIATFAHPQGLFMLVLGAILLAPVLTEGK